MPARDAAALIPSGATVLIDGSGGGVNEPDLVLRALAERYLSTQKPTDLRLVHPNGLGDGKGSGIERLAHPGLIRSVIGGHWGWGSNMQRLARDEEIEAYCLPQGTLSQLLREIAGRRPGVITQVGLGTFVDPRLDGGRFNKRASEELVRVVEIDEQEWLMYRSFPIDVAIIRATVADEAGNLVCDGEGLFCEQLPAAQAAANSGGIVIAQVKCIAHRGTLDPRRVRIPGILVDAIVVDEAQRLSMTTHASPGLTGEVRLKTGPERLTPGVRRVIARRAVTELRQGDTVNLGYGIADGIPSVAAEEGLLDQVTFTIEQGHVGGIPCAGANFGLALNPEASIDATSQFDWYDGGGLDVAFLSFAEIDEQGCVNVSRFAGRSPGVGGFINIAHGARRLVLLGTFAAGKADIRVEAGSIRIAAEAETPKFVAAVKQISFDAARAARAGKRVTVITERAVFAIAPEGLELREVAPGLDPETEVIARMGFRPRVPTEPRAMDTHVFSPTPTGITLEPARHAAGPRRLVA